MALQKQPLDISFQRGLDLKSDPKRVPIGSFLRLVNSVFTKTGLLQKRNGFPSLTSLPVTDTTFLTTFNDDLTAIGTQIYAYNLPNQTWILKDILFPCKLATLSLVRKNTTQTQCDSVTAPNGLVCTVYTDQDQTNLAKNTYFYVIADESTGQNILPPTQLTEADSSLGTPRVFLLSNNYFVILYTQNAGQYHIRYIAIPVSNPIPAAITAPADIVANYGPKPPVSFDAVAFGDKLYIAYNNLGGGQSVNVTFLQNVSTGPGPTIRFNGQNARLFTLSADSTIPAFPIIYGAYNDGNIGSGNVYAFAVDSNLNIIVSPVLITGGAFANLASTGTLGIFTVFLEQPHTYPGSSLPTNYIVTISVSLSPLFTSTFLGGVNTLTVSSTRGIVSGTYIVDNTTPADITSGTQIIAVVGASTLDLNAVTAGGSSLSGDTMVAVSIRNNGIIKRSVGLASKAFLFNGVSYVLVAFNSVYEPSYFLIDQFGNVIAKLAYSNGSLNIIPSVGGYLPFGLPITSFQSVILGSITIGSPIITLQGQSNSGGIFPGMTVTGIGISGNTTVKSVTTTTIQMSSVATLTTSSVLSIGSVQIPYLIKDQLIPVNKNNLALNNVAGLYAQAGVNLASFILGTSQVSAVESAGTLQLSGGIIWSYDGYVAVEQNFLVWPDFVSAVWLANSTVTPTGTTTVNTSILTGLSSIAGIAVGMTITGTNIPAGALVIGILSASSIQISGNATGSGGGITFTLQGNMAGQPGGVGAGNTNVYFYQVVYSWSNNAGNQERSAPSIPIPVTTTGSANTGTVTLTISTDRLTYKTANPIKIEVYRWSAGQQIYYQTTSILLPVLNDTTVDTVTFVDTNTDANIIGNEIIYTNGGVVENIAPPGSSIMTLFQTRMWLVDDEDPNLLWYSKQIIESTPIEMSDLFTLFISPTVGAQGSTGKITALFPLDDKLIVFKKEAIYYLNGLGPDNTGSNSQFSEPIFIASTIGCINQQSLVLIPLGLMFQSDKGIWLLGRDLTTSYIGSRVETLTQNALVVSSLTIPGTNQVRFTMSNGIVIMYDYFFNEWGTFNLNGISSTLFQGLHTYVNSLGQVFQEGIGTYLDGTSPVLMSFTTSWVSLAGIQGLERFYFGFLLGEYITPFKLNVQFAYNFNSSQAQSIIVTPQDYSSPWGGLPFWGTGPEWGGAPSTFRERVFPEKQKCESFQVTVDELYDGAFGTVAGAGLTLSSLALVVGVKRGFRTQSAGKSA